MGAVKRLLEAGQFRGVQLNEEEEFARSPKGDEDSPAARLYREQLRGGNRCFGQCDYLHRKNDVESGEDVYYKIVDVSDQDEKWESWDK